LGRKNRSSAKRQEILDAYTACVLRHGLYDASLGTIAADLGLDRSTMYHYFKSQEDLVGHWIRRIARSYIERFEGMASHRSTKEAGNKLLRFLFAEIHDPTYSRAIDEISTYGNHNARANQLLREMYASIESAVIRELAHSYPRASPKLRQSIGSAIVQMSEGCSLFIELGFQKNRVKFARTAARHLLEQLESANEIAGNTKAAVTQGTAWRD